MPLVADANKCSPDSLADPIRFSENCTVAGPISSAPAVQS
jgi:hypothetical protein